jgi:hypothetical protein
VSESIEAEARTFCPWKDTDHLSNPDAYCTWCDGFITARRQSETEVGRALYDATWDHEGRGHNWSPWHSVEGIPDVEQRDCQTEWCKAHQTRPKYETIK